MEKILVPVDGSAYSLHALDVAMKLAAPLGARLELLHVVDLGKAAAMTGAEPLLLEGCYEELQDEGKRIVEEAVAHVGSAAAVTTEIRAGVPVEEIHKATLERAPSFIVIGSHGRSGVARLMMGSVAEGVARGSTVPVMIVPGERHAHGQKSPAGSGASVTA